MTPAPVITAFQKQANGIFCHLKEEFAKLQTGRASASIIEHVLVAAYGQRQELRTLASIAVADGRTLTVQPWDRGIFADVERALLEANLGVSPVNEGSLIRIVLPPMTEERRRELTRVVAALAEQARVQLRKERETARRNIKELSDEDDRLRLEKELQREVEKMNEEIAKLAKGKESDVLTV
jgi:ribosome recycling factor